jgi:opacity protein-like surface antigen
MKIKTMVVMAAMVAGTSTAQADWDMPFFGDNNNNDWDMPFFGDNNNNDWNNNDWDMPFFGDNNSNDFFGNGNGRGWPHR